MILTFMTKRNANGHRNYLIIDTDGKLYARNPRGIVWKDDATETTAKELKAIFNKVSQEYKETDFI